MSYVTNTTKLSVSSTSLNSEKKYLKSKFSNNSENSTPLRTEDSIKGSDPSGISSIISELSNDRTTYFTFLERRKTTN